MKIISIFLMLSILTGCQNNMNSHSTSLQKQDSIDNLEKSHANDNNSEEVSDNQFVYFLDNANFIEENLHEYDFSKELEGNNAFKITAVKKSEENGNYIIFPQFTDMENNKLETQINTKMFEEGLKKAYFYDFYNMDFEICYLDTKFISIIFNSDIAYGARARKEKYGLNIDLETGDLIKLTDISNKKAVVEYIENEKFKKVDNVHPDDITYKQLSTYFATEINDNIDYQNMPSYNIYSCFFFTEDSIGIYVLEANYYNKLVISMSDIEQKAKVNEEFWNNFSY